MPRSEALHFDVIGMDCADDAREIEEAVARVAGVAAAKVSAATHVLTVSTNAANSARVQQAVERLGYQLAPSQSATAPRADVPTRYKKALWIVVALNVGFGAVEIVGGFLSGSQALKADALDFLGDGLITLLGILAIGWSLAWRARSALIQGIFLACLGVGVLATTLYRIVVQSQPEAEVMGVLGVIALLVNVAAAAVLIPHRTGDANARAVWLFSRNDAIGNAAVVVAALLVGWTGSAWPDLAVAVIIAGLFLNSASSIIRDARADLREVGAL